MENPNAPTKPRTLKDHRHEPSLCLADSLQIKCNAANEAVCRQFPCMGGSQTCRIWDFKFDCRLCLQQYGLQ